QRGCAEASVDITAVPKRRVTKADITIFITGKTKTGRLWTYVRDERPFAGSRPPAALFFYSPDRKGEHPRGPSEGLPRRHPRRRLCRVQRTVCRRQDCRGRLPGPCATQILRCPRRHRLADR